MSHWTLAENPSRGRLVCCHGGSPSIDIVCPHCGRVMHLHAGMLPEGVDVAGRCPQCRAVSILDRNLLARGLAEAAQPTDEKDA